MSVYMGWWPTVYIMAYVSVTSRRQGEESRPSRALARKRADKRIVQLPESSWMPPGGCVKIVAAQSCPMLPSYLMPSPVIFSRALARSLALSLSLSLSLCLSVSIPLSLTVSIPSKAYSWVSSFCVG